MEFLVLFGHEKMIPFTVGWDILSVKKVVLHMFFLIIMQKIKIGLYDSLPPQKRLTLHNVIILIKSVFNKDQNQFYYNIILEKCWNQWHKK